MNDMPEDVRVNEAELRRGSYRCDPGCCTGRVCCAVFDVALTREERERLLHLLPQIVRFCPWLAEGEDPFQTTPCEIFIRKRGDGLCWFNFRDATGRVWCGVHAAALAAGENPYVWKPLNCAVWPFLRDGAGQLTLDEDDSFPCLCHAGDDAPQLPVNDPELTALLRQLAEAGCGVTIESALRREGF